jgi:hypothetical protein
MKTNSKLMVAAAAFVVSTSAFAQEAEKPVTVKTDGLPDHVRARIEEKAQKGLTELTRYVNSTRHIHNLRVEFIVKPEDASTTAKVSAEPSKVAERAEDRK